MKLECNSNEKVQNAQDNIENHPFRCSSLYGSELRVNSGDFTAMAMRIS
jgi:hypothetical protein